MKKVLSVILVCVLMLGIAACEKKRTKRYASPTGKYVIYVEYDSKSRPTVKYNGEVIIEASGKGYQEEVTYDVVWVKEDTVKLVHTEGNTTDEIMVYLGNLE